MCIFVNSIALYSSPFVKTKRFKEWNINNYSTNRKNNEKKESTDYILIKINVVKRKKKIKKNERKDIYIYILSILIIHMV